MKKQDCAVILNSGVGNPQIALTGAEFEAELDGRPVPAYTSVEAPANSVLKIGAVCSCPIAV